MEFGFNWTRPTCEVTTWHCLYRLQAAQKAESKAHSPPPSYCSGDTREPTATSRSSGATAAVSAAQSRPTTSTAAAAAATATSRSRAAVSTTGASRVVAAAADARTPSFAAGSQSLDNIDLAIFGSVVRMTDSSTAGAGGDAAAAAGVGPGGAGVSGSGVVLDVGKVFTGSLPPARLALPRFRPRTNRGHVFDPTRLLQVHETAERDRGPVFNCL